MGIYCKYKLVYFEVLFGSVVQFGNAYIYIYICVCMYTGCPGRNVPDFGRMFLKLKYTDITQNTSKVERLRR